MSGLAISYFRTDNGTLAVTVFFPGKVLSFFKKLIVGSVLFLMMFHQAMAVSESVHYAASSVIVSDYCRFLRKEARVDNCHLYDPKMECDPPMIKRSQRSGKYQYEDFFPKRNDPITYVSRLSQARFCNWKENGEKSGSTETGVYDLTSLTNATDAFGFDFIPEPNTHYRLDSKLNNVDPMLGLGEDGFVIESVNHDHYDFMEGIDDSSFLTANSLIEKNAVSQEPEHLLLGNSLMLPSTDKNLSSQSTDAAKTQVAPVFASSSMSLYTAGLCAGAPCSLLASATLKTGSKNSSFLPPNNPGTKIRKRITHQLPPIKIKLITIDYPNNSPDMREHGGWGAADKVFQIGETDVTAEQYALFLNAVATNDDPYAFYNTNMGLDSNVACITREGANSPYSYTVIPGREKFPVTYISVVTAAAFCNWMENIESNKPINGEESVLTGAFNITYITKYSTNYTTSPPHWSFNGTLLPGVVTVTVTSHIVPDNVIPNTNAHWSLPLEDQWYKAAYYQPPTVGLDGWSSNDQCYYLYGTSNDLCPTNSIGIAAVSHNDANFCLVDSTNGLHYTLTNEPHLTPVGFFKKTKSPFGLYDMSGNVDQWVLIDAGSREDGTHIWRPSVRGGSWQSTNNCQERLPNGAFNLETGELGVSSMRRIIPFATTTNTIGFRVVYNVSPEESGYDVVKGGLLRLPVRFWEGVKTTAYDFYPPYFIHHASSAGLDFLSWGFGMIIPEFTEQFLLGVHLEVSAAEPSLLGIGKGVVTAFGKAIERTFIKVGSTVRAMVPRAVGVGGAAATEEVVVGEAAAVVGGGVATSGEASLAALALPPPFDLLGAVGLVGLGIVSAYYGDNVDQSEAGFGILLNGAYRLWHL